MSIAVASLQGFQSFSLIGHSRRWWMIHQQPNTRQALCFLSQRENQQKLLRFTPGFPFLSLSLTPEFLLSRFIGTE
ncbi:hypothetical protein Hanom_Chr01g00009241 [Helianthus anomalus]